MPFMEMLLAYLFRYASSQSSPESFRELEGKKEPISLAQEMGKKQISNRYLASTKEV